MTPIIAADHRLEHNAPPTGSSRTPVPATCPAAGTTRSTSRVTRPPGSGRYDMGTLAPASSVRWHADVAADLRELIDVRTVLAEALEVCGWGEEDAFRVLICADEAIANALSHGSRGAGTIGAAFRVTASTATVLVSDRNRGAVEIPETQPVPAESSEHGRGLILMRALADRMRLRCGPRGTALALRFTPSVAGRPRQLTGPA